jgi:hypothetical protein
MAGNYIPNTNGGAMSFSSTGSNRSCASASIIIYPVVPGYGWIRTFPYGEQPIAYEFDEHRIWEQLVLTQKVGRFNFNHRYRLEQRFLEQKNLAANDEFTLSGFQFRQRLRYRFLVTIPLLSSELKDNSPFIAIYDEPFIQFGRNIGRNILDQNRLYFALGWRIDKDRNIQAGYLNQYVVKPDGVHAERNHTLQLGITWNLDLRKNTEK